MDDQALAEIIKKMAKDSSFIVSSPDTIKQLQARGVEITTPPPVTKEQYLNELFNNRRDIADSVIDKLPKPPQLANPAVQSLYHEITECILFGQYGAAITLSAILLEFVLKYKNVEKKGSSNELELWDYVEKDLSFMKAVKEAKGLGVITDEEEEKLISFKNSIRNPYGHYNIRKIIKDVIAGQTSILNTETGEVESVDLLAADNPPIWFSAKSFVDSQQVFEVFTFVDEWVKKILE